MGARVVAVFALLACLLPAAETRAQPGRENPRDCLATLTAGIAESAQILRAIAVCDRLLGDEALDPRIRHAALLARSVGHLKRGAVEAALADANAALALKPGDAQALAIRGNVLIASARPEEAAADLEAALAGGAAPAFYNMLGTARCQAGQRDAAYAAFLTGLDRGNDPKTLQRVLEAHGSYTGGIDGAFGRGSRAALRQWIAEGCP